MGEGVHALKELLTNSTISNSVNSTVYNSLVRYKQVTSLFNNYNAIFGFICYSKVTEKEIIYVRRIHHPISSGSNSKRLYRPI